MRGFFSLEGAMGEMGLLGVPVPRELGGMGRDYLSYILVVEELAKVGYELSSAYTMVRSLDSTRFVYRDSVWAGCDLLGTGVASFSHLGGVHLHIFYVWC